MTALLEVRDVEVSFPIGGGLFTKPSGMVRAVDGISLDLGRGEIVAIVGESGCGKTTLARTLLGLIRPSVGMVRVQGLSADAGDPAGRREYLRNIQMVFQDPFDSLNPRKTVFQTVAQPLRIHGIVPDSELRAEVARLLDAVGLSPGESYLDRYPHQFSGGQRQRIGIARAIAVRPAVVVADEPVSALDVSIRAQILMMMRELKEQRGLSYVFITHDLGVVRSFCDRVLVMYLGRIVEQGRTEDIFNEPRHPYTRALLAACPSVDPGDVQKERREILTGDVPSPVNPPSGCRFHPRCPMAQPVCSAVEPPIKAFKREQLSACHFAEAI